MTQHTVSPWHFYQGWDVYQGHLVKAIGPLTAEQLELRIAPSLRSIGLLAKHIVRTRAGWLSGLMGEGGPDVAAIAQWNTMATYHPLLNWCAAWRSPFAPGRNACNVGHWKI